MDERRIIDNEDELMAILKSIDPNGKMRQVYLSQSDTWHYTQSGDDPRAIDRRLITALVGSGVLGRVYNNTGDTYWLGPTMDVDATVSERARTGVRHTIVYEVSPQRRARA